MIRSACACLLAITATCGSASANPIRALFHCYHYHGPTAYHSGSYGYYGSPVPAGYGSPYGYYGSPYGYYGGYGYGGYGAPGYGAPGDLINLFQQFLANRGAGAPAGPGTGPGPNGPRAVGSTPEASTTPNDSALIHAKLDALKEMSKLSIENQVRASKKEDAIPIPPASTGEAVRRALDKANW